jgi:hypothetical protein
MFIQLYDAGLQSAYARLAAVHESASGTKQEDIAVQQVVRY